ncbi:MAG: glycosyltransferase [Erysipelotrichaceae bacterium]|nr:glycosyltransferase [Erysipelotrichaceae bacterium]
MIKILFYIDELSAGGAEKVLCNLVNNMDPSSFDITVHTTWKSDAKSLLKPHVKYKYVFSERNKISRFIYRAETQLGLFYQLHLKGDYDIEVAYLECGPTKVMASSTNKIAAHVAWIHCDLAKKFLDIDQFAKQTRNHYKKYDQVVCVSEACKESYDQYFKDCVPSLVLHNVIDTEEIINKSKVNLNLDLKKKNLTFVAVGRQSYEKNYMMLLRVHKQLLDEGYKHSLWLIGEGSETVNLKKYVNDERLNDSVSFFGFQSNPYPIMKEADVLVSSSIYEGFSTVINEALILGLPVITTDCSGMREILGDSEYGMITENNENAFKDGMRKMLSDHELRNDYKEKAIIRSAQLTGKAIAEMTESFFESLVRRKH